ncbi:serine hydrolase [Streptomyces sporangiiformans]|uniref:serine hydrolase n=1 Tax=Streptomyces sporangiiformans TaxID=2315329 RepID=UPI003B8A6028
MAAYLDGELVVDVWAGVTDRATGHDVDGDSLFPLHSCGKGVTATAIRPRRTGVSLRQESAVAWASGHPRRRAVRARHRTARRRVGHRHRRPQPRQ